MVPECIWRIWPGHGTSELPGGDLHMITAMGRALETFHEGRVEEGMDLLMDNIEFGVYVHRHITEKRRERMK